MEIVNHPSHYSKKGVLECVDVIRFMTKGLTGMAAFNVGQFVKYAYRAGEKGDKITDYRKALWYVSYSCNHYDSTYSAVQTSIDMDAFNECSRAVCKGKTVDEACALNCAMRALYRPSTKVEYEKARDTLKTMIESLV